MRSLFCLPWRLRWDPSSPGQHSARVCDPPSSRRTRPDRRWRSFQGPGSHFGTTSWCSGMSRGGRRCTQLQAKHTHETRYETKMIFKINHNEKPTSPRANARCIRLLRVWTLRGQMSKWGTRSFGLFHRSRRFTLLAKVLFYNDPLTWRNPTGLGKSHFLPGKNENPAELWPLRAGVRHLSPLVLELPVSPL